MAPKSRMGLRKAQRQIELAIARLNEAVYLSEFDLKFLGESATESEHAFGQKIKAAAHALQAAHDAGKESSV